MTRYFQKFRSLFKKLNKKNASRVFLASVVFVLIILAGVSSYFISYFEKVYPGISVAGVNLGGNSYQDAAAILSEKIKTPSEVKLIYKDRVFIIKTEDVGLSYDIPRTIDMAYNLARTGNLFQDAKTRVYLLFSRTDLGLLYNINHEGLVQKISEISQQISTEPIYPSITLNGEEIIINNGSPGEKLNQDLLVENIGDALSKNLSTDIQIPTEVVDPTLSTDEIKAYSDRANKFIGKSINMNFEYSTFTLKDSEIIQLLDPISGYKDRDIESFIDKTTISIERKPQNSKFIFKDGRVSEFQPALNGITVDDNAFKNLLIETLNKLYASDDKTTTFSIPVSSVAPDITIDEVNDLGIKELIGRGTSTYYHSIASRVHNVALAASRINGTLVKPGETFSFNQALGEVSASTGYQQAYIISEGRTILGDGGGVCQVSTTLFRALLNAGLPIVERQAHAYRVSYYEQDSLPGLDATVYSPSPDLKFTNDTPGYILIEAIANTKNYSLVFELYGASDGRVSTISKPVISGVTAPPEDLYQDDPTLPAGTIKQIDWKAWGSKVTFNYVVTKNGKEIINKNFISNYKPWRSIYLRGTGPAN